MQLLGISTNRPWIDHPTYDRDPYRSSTQYVNQSGWSSQITGGAQLPASHFGGGHGDKLKEKEKRRRRQHPGDGDNPSKRGTHRRRRKSSIERREGIPPGQQRLRFVGKEHSPMPERTRSASPGYRTTHDAMYDEGETTRRERDRREKTRRASVAAGYKSKYLERDFSAADRRRRRGLSAVSYTHLTLPTKRIV